MRSTWKAKTLAVLIRNRDWMWSYELIGEKQDIFLSHRCPARASDLTIEYPSLVEVDRKGKVHRYRFRADNTLEFMQIIPQDLKEVVIAELKRLGGSYEVHDKEPEYLPNGMVRLKEVIKVIKL